VSQELKAFVINMKSLYQDIEDPIVVGGGDSNGRSLRVIFTQEAAAQFAPATKVYLSWFHQENKTKGYNVFTRVSEDPETWELHYPNSMLSEGNVLACVELVDDISIASSNNFTIHVLANVNDGTDYVNSSDYSDFQKVAIEANCLTDQMKKQMELQKLEFSDMETIVMNCNIKSEESAAKVEAGIAQIEENISKSEEIQNSLNEQFQNQQNEFAETLKEIQENLSTSQANVAESKEIVESAQDIKDTADTALEIAQQASESTAKAESVVVYEW
jgi:hypothetical protein